MRQEGWPLRLETLISAARNRKFEWGRHDCGTFAAEVVKAITARSLNLPKGYTTARGSALAMRRKTGASDMAGATSYFLGEPLDSPLQAMRGDVVLHTTQALGVCIGADALCLSENGLVAVPMTDCVKAWRI